jgi:hypothetical protein
MKTTIALFICGIVGVAVAHPNHSWETDLAQHFGTDNGPVEITNASNEVHIKVEGEVRVIQANGIPNHERGEFPNRNNPNRIAPQNYNFTVPVKPKAASSPTRLFMQPFGVAVNGVVFDPFAAEWWENDRSSIWQYEPMNMIGRLGADQNNAHVQPGGVYHYHSVPTGLIEKISNGKLQMTLVGWAADGFPIYAPLCYSEASKTNSPLKPMQSSYELKKGTRPSGPGGNYDGTFVADYEFIKNAGDLDECNGRFGVTPEFPEGTYYYVLTDGFPFIPRFFKGTPDKSFARKGPPGRGPRPGRPPESRGEPTRRSNKGQAAGRDFLAESPTTARKTGSEHEASMRRSPAEKL